jgi:hypothetical protein
MGRTRAREPRPADGLRTTPSRFAGRDVELFPEAGLAAATGGQPSKFYLLASRTHVVIVHERFPLPEWLAADLSARYATYLRAWAREPDFPSDRVGSSGPPAFRGGAATVTIRRADAAEWIAVFRRAMAHIFDGEQWLRQALASLEAR